MESRPLMILRLETSATEEIGATPHGRILIFPITGGSFEGERLRGRVLAGGGDWVTARADGTFELDLRARLDAPVWNSRASARLRGPGGGNLIARGERHPKRFVGHSERDHGRR